jgi:TPP-dependent 2-oxoacid decarboxylase
MEIWQYLINAVQKAGADHVFGIQGDYVLNFFSRAHKSSLKVVNMCDEQGAGFAADGYARINGFGAVCATYGPGCLKLVNPTAQAYAELSPVLVISGVPGVSERGGDPLLHHKVKSFDTQLNVFKEMTCAQAQLSDAKTAAEEIDRVIAAVKRSKRPGYIELPRDMVNAETVVCPKYPEQEKPVDKEALDRAVDRAVGILSKAQKPVISVGMEVHRFGFQKIVLELIERSGFPFVTGVLSKSVITEFHPQFCGVYAGAMSPEPVQQLVEGADGIIAVGPLLSDLATGIFNFDIDIRKTIVPLSERVIIGGKEFYEAGIGSFVPALTEKADLFKKPDTVFEKNKTDVFVPVSGQKITMKRLIAALNGFLDGNMIVVADAGDAMFAGLDLVLAREAGFLSPAYYASTGFAVPAAVGAKAAAPDKRVIVLEGDGSFQMTGMEISTAAGLGHNTVVIILNNGGYGTFRKIIDGPYNDLHNWNYAGVPEALNSGKGFAVRTEDDLISALFRVKDHPDEMAVIEVVLDRMDFSERSLLLTSRIKSGIK